MLRMKFLSLTVIAVSLSSSSAFQIFGFNFGEADSSNKIAITPTEPVAKVADDFSAGSGESVCRAGDAICEASASTPKLANAKGAPRYVVIFEPSPLKLSVREGNLDGACQSSSFVQQISFLSEGLASPAYLLFLIKIMTKIAAILIV